MQPSQRTLPVASGRMITSTDIVLAAVLRVLVMGGRNRTFVSTETPLDLMCFLGKFIAKQYLTITEFINDINSVGNLASSDFSKEFNVATSFDTVDLFVEFCSELPQLLIPPALADHNNVFAPTLICPSSSLGLFCRSFIVKYESSTFEELCRSFDQFADFKIASASNTDGTSVSTNPATKATGQQNCFATEKSIHNYFDRDGNIMLSSNPAPIHTFDNLTDQSLLSTSRHQMSMLSLATLWAQQNYGMLAWTAVEETLKLAHQRGDDLCVTRALLIMFEISKGQNNYHMHRRPVQDSHAPIVVVTDLSFSNDILMRCLSRCVVLQLAELGCDVAMRQVEALTDCSMSCEYSPYSKHVFAVTSAASFSVEDSHSHSRQWRGRGSGSGSYGVRPQDLWKLCSATLYGDINLSLTLATDLGLSSSVKSSPQCSRASSALAIAAPADHWAAATLQNLILRTAMLAIRMWSRAGAYDMATLACLRALHSCRHDLHDSNRLLLVRLYCLQIEVTFAAADCMSCHTQSTMTNACKQAKALYQILEKFSGKDSRMKESLQRVQVLILLHTAWNKSDLASAARHAKQFEKLAVSSHSSHLQARILAARVYQDIDPLASVKMLQGVVSSTESNSTEHVQAMAMMSSMALRNHLIAREEASATSAQSIQLSRIGFFPVVELYMSV